MSDRHRHGAQIVFLQVEAHQWSGRLLSNKARDSQSHDEPAHTENGYPLYQCTINEDEKTGQCVLTTRGPSMGAHAIAASIHWMRHRRRLSSGHAAASILRSKGKP